MFQIDTHKTTRRIAMVSAAILLTGVAMVVGGCGGGSTSYDGYTVPNTAPTASDFSCSSSVGNTAATCSWSTKSSAKDADGNTLTAALYKSGAPTDPVYTGTGTFTLSGDTITYTPNSGTTATSDSVTLRISDGKGGYKDVTASVSGIDFVGPTLTQSSTSSVFMSYSTNLVANESLTGFSRTTTYYNPGTGTYGALPTGVSDSLTPTGLVGGLIVSQSQTYSLTRTTGPAGTYRVVFNLTDSLFNTSTYTLYITLL